MSSRYQPSSGVWPPVLNLASTVFSSLVRELSSPVLYFIAWGNFGFADLSHFSLQCFLMTYFALWKSISVSSWGRSQASLASLSAVSLPSIPQWPGIHWNVTSPIFPFWRGWRESWMSFSVFSWCVLANCSLVTDDSESVKIVTLWFSVTSPLLWSSSISLSRRLGVAGHCVRHPEEASHHTILWEPTHGKSRRGAPSMNYVTLLKKDTGYVNTHEIRAAMQCRETWSGVARCFSASTG